MFRCSSLPRYAPFIGKQDNAFGYHLGSNWTAADERVSFNAVGGSFAISNSPLADGIAHTAIGIYDGSLGSANTKLYIDGTLQTITATRVGAIPNTIDPISLGASGLFYYPGHLFEILLLARAITAAERADLQTYLKSRWGTV